MSMAMLADRYTERLVSNDLVQFSNLTVHGGSLIENAPSMQVPKRHACNKRLSLAITAWSRWQRRRSCTSRPTSLLLGRLLLLLSFNSFDIRLYLLRR